MKIIRPARKFGIVSALAIFLVSNIEETPQEILSRYLDRVQIEEVFKSSKSFEGLLPLSKWTALTVKGKILTDIIDTIIRTVLLQLLPQYTGNLMDFFIMPPLSTAFGDLIRLSLSRLRTSRQKQRTSCSRKRSLARSISRPGKANCTSGGCSEPFLQLYG